ncbi:hypothetical protein B296_00056198 [Ensete ventricosum]|uniref:Uncharacterized protein n=1 Tax=Ensete ventricosum TaxID=4639 RepID=A0A426XW29_ENSVE|nr:hypothetical protein B296_00056198 [Ensete ventricosum]
MQTASRLIRRLPATERHCGFSPVPFDIGIKRENLRWCRPLTARRWLGYRRCLRSENLGTTSQMRTSRGSDFFAAVFSSFEATRKRGKRRRFLIRAGRSLNDF